MVMTTATTISRRPRSGCRSPGKPSGMTSPRASNMRSQPVLRDVVGIQDRHEAQDRGGDDDAQDNLGPDRFDRELMGDLVAARGGQRQQRPDHGQSARRPSSGFAQRAVDAAEKQEGLVERADRLAVGHVPRHVAPDEKPAQRDDEGGDREIADSQPLNAPMITPVARPTGSPRARSANAPARVPSHCGTTTVCTIAITAEQVASSEPTERSIWRVTITKTMPVAMIATETVWIVRLKMLRGSGSARR
jgi:hypothetical protein